MYLFVSNEYVMVVVLSCIFRICCSVCIFFCKQKTAYELRISDWSSDVCSSDLVILETRQDHLVGARTEVKIFPIAAGLFHLLGNARADREIGRASCRERVCQSV